ncbi:hypothetical protein [Streptomyces endophyticus]|uniref:Uncharacterized protein n=1 Tax=Streptomyces endophyticus TaxID=714166 RepID=A0ABU6FDZ0_9ACTN|nr:hypothetical protein [Streptomyces endophyticus]MEB8342261.1 hypothetical protein [Streptomyces endophyticus]
MPATSGSSRIPRFAGDASPCGGISRLRLFGSPTDQGRSQLVARHAELGE